MLRERGGWATALVAIAAFYVVFAIETGDRTTIVAQSGLATGFVVLALAVLLMRGAFVSASPDAPGAAG